MANELMQGLLSSLLQPQQQQGPDPQSVMAALNTQNPVASVMALNMPNITANMGGMFRRAIGGRGGIGTMNAQEAMAESLGKADLTTSAGLTQAAKNAMATGNRALALQFTLQAQELAKQEEANRQATLQQQLQRATGVQAIEGIIKSLDPEKDAAYINDLTGFMNQVAAGGVTPDKVQAGINAVAERNEKETPKLFEFEAEWKAWQAGQPEGASLSYPAFLQWKRNLTTQDTEYQTWVKQNPDSTIEEFWRSKEEARTSGRAAASPTDTRPVATPSAREQNQAQLWLTESLKRPRSFLGMSLSEGAAVPADQRERMAAAIANEAALIKAEQGGTLDQHFAEAARRLKASNRIVVNEDQTITLAAPVSPFPTASVDDFYN